MAGALLLWFGQGYAQSDWLEFQSRFLTPEAELEQRYELLQKAAMADPGDPFLPIAEAELAVEISRANLQEAEAAYRRSYDLFPQNPHLLVALGETLDELGRSAEATRFFEEALYWAPSYGVTRYAYATHLLRTGKEVEAVDAFRRANEASAYPWAAQSGRRDD